MIDPAVAASPSPLLLQPGKLLGEFNALGAAKTVRVNEAAAGADLDPGQTGMKARSLVEQLLGEVLEEGEGDAAAVAEAACAMESTAVDTRTHTHTHLRTHTHTRLAWVSLAG